MAENFRNKIFGLIAILGDYSKNVTYYYKPDGRYIYEDESLFYVPGKNDIKLLEKFN
jgi:hypothetical protein